ncbi:MAG: hypothetical protein GF308_15865 [Candidatus Heimdallarchaeota archaeon]|nr:hypothetical protein [Candidatus Heimdallarchaeota archaeon]
MHDWQNEESFEYRMEESSFSLCTLMVARILVAEFKEKASEEEHLLSLDIDLFKLSAGSLPFFLFFSNTPETEED